MSAGTNRPDEGERGSRFSAFIRQNVVGFTALFVALGTGGAYASNHLIGTDDIQRYAVTTPKIAKAAVTPGKIAPEAIRRPKILDGAVSTDKLADDAVDSSKVLDGSLTGADINQATLDAVDAARLGGNLPGAFGPGVIMGRIDDLNTEGGSTWFGHASGISTASPDESARTLITPAVETVARDLSVRLSRPPGAFGRARSIGLLVNGADGLFCHFGVNDTTCNDTATTLVPPGSTLTIELANVGAELDPADAMFAFRLTMP